MKSREFVVLSSLIVGGAEAIGDDLEESGNESS